MRIIIAINLHKRLLNQVTSALLHVSWTDGQTHDANSRSYYVQYDRLKMTNKACHRRNILP